MKMKRPLVIAAVVLAASVLALAQGSNTNSTSTRTRTVAPKPSPTPKTATKPTYVGASTLRPKSAEAGAQVSPSTGVLSAFNSLLDGIRHADVKAVTNAYQNSPRLVLFNYNGTVTRGWDQLKQNREASYPEIKDVKLDVKDLRVTVLGRDAALITCQWTQSMTLRGTSVTDTRPMTHVIRTVSAYRVPRIVNDSVHWQ